MIISPELLAALRATKLGDKRNGCIIIKSIKYPIIVENNRDFIRASDYENFEFAIKIFQLDIFYAPQPTFPALARLL
jgi:hypothetical protein